MGKTAVVGALALLVIGPISVVLVTGLVGEMSDLAFDLLTTVFRLVVSVAGTVLGLLGSFPGAAGGLAVMVLVVIGLACLVWIA